MTFNEKTTLCLSGLALLISAITLYFTYFHKKIALIGFLICCQINHEDPESDYEFSFSNTGNRELLIKDASVDLSDAPDEEHIVPEVSPAELPLILKPSQMTLVKLKVPNRFLEKASKNNQRIIFRFMVFSPQGNTYLMEKAIIPFNENNIEEPTENHSPFKLGKALK